MSLIRVITLSYKILALQGEMGMARQRSSRSVAIGNAHTGMPIIFYLSHVHAKY